MALRYIEPKDCDTASKNYSSYACEEVPGSYGNSRTECIGSSQNPNNKNRFKNCKKCLENCGNNPLSDNDKDPIEIDDKDPIEIDDKDTRTETKQSSESFYKNTGGKFIIFLGGCVLLVLIILIIKHFLSKPNLSYSFEEVHWRR